MEGFSSITSFRDAGFICKVPSDPFHAEDQAWWSQWSLLTFKSVKVETITNIMYYWNMHFLNTVIGTKNKFLNIHCPIAPKSYPQPWLLLCPLTPTSPRVIDTFMFVSKILLGVETIAEQSLDCSSDVLESDFEEVIQMTPDPPFREIKRRSIGKELPESFSSIHLHPFNKVFGVLRLSLWEQRGKLKYWYWFFPETQLRYFSRCRPQGR